MKTLYVILLFFAVFQISTLLVGSLGIFPMDSVLYSDFETAELESYAQNGSYLDAFGYVFAPGDTIFGISIAKADISIIIGVVCGVSAILGIATHHPSIGILPIMGILFIPMITQSGNFFRSIAMKFSSTALMYIFVIIMLQVIVVFLFTIIETPTHGRS